MTNSIKFNPFTSNLDIVGSGGGGGGVISVNGCVGAITITGLALDVINACPAISIENRRWLSPFVVDPSAVPGVRGTFTTIQAAINAAFAAGGGKVFIRQGTYGQNLSLQPGVNLIGVDADGRAGAGSITINGTHSLATPGVVVIESIALFSAAGDIFTATNSSGLSVIVVKFCEVEANAGSCFTSNCTLTGTSNFSSFDCTLTADASVINLVQNAHNGSSHQLSNLNSMSSSVLNASTIGSVNFRHCRLNASTNGIIINDAGMAVTSDYTRIASGDEAILFSAAGSIEFVHGITTCSPASGFWVTGVGTLSYADIVNKGVTGIDPATTAIPYDWQPYSTANTSVLAVRGTSGFDDSQFTVTNGFVQKISSPIITKLIADGSFIKNANSSLIEVVAWGGSGGGGGGPSLVGNSLGGNSSAPGSFVANKFEASQFAVVIAVTVGVGGAGGAGALIAGGNGANGAAGTATVIPLISGSIIASGSAGGNGGTAVGSGSNSTAFICASFTSTQDNNGTNQRIQGDIAAGGIGLNMIGIGASSSGGGGGAFSFGSPLDGVSGGTLFNGTNIVLAGGLGGIGDGTAGGNGVNASTTSWITGGSGGGGGSYSLLANAGSGGDGGIPSGGAGAGGGAQLGIGAGGDGGDGARGEVWFIEYF